MTLEDERFVVTSTFTAVQFENGGRTVTIHAYRVPLAVIDCDGCEPKILLFRAEAVEIEAETQSSFFDLNE